MSVFHLGQFCVRACGNLYLVYHRDGRLLFKCASRPSLSDCEWALSHPTGRYVEPHEIRAPKKRLRGVAKAR